MSQFSHAGVYTIQQAPPRNQIYKTQKNDYSTLGAKRACTNGGVFHVEHLIHKEWKKVETPTTFKWFQFHRCLACEKVVYDERREDHQALMDLVLRERNQEYISPPVHWRDDVEETTDQGASQSAWGQ